MTTPPLFNTSLAALKAGLRLSGSTQPDTQAILDRALQEVRLGFYESLSEARISQILETPLSSAPTTLAQRDRSKAALIETLWVKFILLLELPTMFLDSSGQADQVWNEEGLIRESQTSKIQKMRDDLWLRITGLLDELRGKDSDGGLRATTFSPDPPVLRPRGSISPLRNFLP